MIDHFKLLVVITSSASAKIVNKLVLLPPKNACHLVSDIGSTSQYFSMCHDIYCYGLLDEYTASTNSNFMKIGFFNLPRIVYFNGLYIWRSTYLDKVLKIALYLSMVILKLNDDMIEQWNYV